MMVIERRDGVRGRVSDDPLRACEGGNEGERGGNVLDVGGYQSEGRGGTCH